MWAGNVNRKNVKAISAPQQTVWGRNSFLLWLNVLTCGIIDSAEEAEARLKSLEA